MKYLFIFTFILNSAWSLTLERKIQLEKQAYDLKIELEKKQLLLSSKNAFSLSSLKNALADTCVEWVYQGSASREESAEACRGVRSMECLSFVYQGSASRVESAQACRGVINSECLSFVYQGSSSRTESAQACAGVTDMDCVRFVYQGSASRREAAESCGRSRPTPPQCASN
jgi:hypothetical protein